ncbi:MAG: replication-associated recombination protein A [Burkholderiales bacterium]
MSDLFERKVPAAPLADRLRPQRLEDVVGQTHLLGEGKPLRLAFESGKPHSMILWGPPGSGKTTLARLMARIFNTEFIALSAVLSGVKDIREALERAELVLQQSGRHTILFIDEVHRFNKAQQDAFLPFVEQGLVTFIGATTENPSFEVISALLSRAAVYVLHPLSDEELGVLFDRAKKLAIPGATFTDEAKSLLVSYADGDARRLLNMLEQLATAVQQSQTADINAQYVQNVLAQSVRRFDKGGDAFYDQISALHKSVRGSDPDASLYWMCRMLDGGADPRYIGRRLVRMAVEDVGLADPRALRIALDSCEVYERLGSPEGELALAEAVVYLACTARSNAVYMAYNDARRFISGDKSRPVPEHLRNAPTKLMKEMGFGKDYRYAHNEPEAYAAGENYFPDGMPAQNFYQPTERGLEAKIAEHLKHLRELDQKTKKK